MWNLQEVIQQGCNFVSTLDYSYRRHIPIHGDCLYECEICKKKSPTHTSDLNTHVLIHVDLISKTAFCTEHSEDLK